MKIDRIVEEVVALGRGAEAALALEDGRTLSYAELAGRIGAAAQELTGAGLAPGQRMVLLGENSEDMVVALMAAIRAGAWAVPLNARMSAGEVDAICAHCEPRLVYFAAEASADARAHAERRGAQGTREALPGGRLQTFEGAGTAAEASGDGDPDDVALMIYTSGSTGMPKGVMLTHANLDFVTRVARQQEVLMPGDVVFHALPISHSFGLITVLLCGLRAGATLRLVDRFSAEKLGNAIADGTVTVFPGVPAMYARLHEWAQHNGRTLTPNRMRMAYIGGSLIDASRKAQSEALLGLRLHHGYGLTESAPSATRTFGHPPPKDITAGWPIPGVEVVLMDADGTPVADGERGEVCIRGPNVMRGYFRDPEQTRAAIDAEGWLHTGDVGLFGSEGDLSIVGRSKEMIIRGGFNVYPAEVEKAIAGFPHVAQCAVVGRSVPGDEEIVAYVEPEQGHIVDLARLRAFLRERLAPYKVPAEVHTMAQLPATGTGKLLKAKLKALANEAPARARPSLDGLLAPRSVAVVGASDNPNKVGGRPIKYLKEQGFAGRIYPVNPRADRVQGLPAYAALDRLPQVPDAVILCIGAEQAEQQLNECVRLGVRHALLFASGYAEVGAEGRVRQERLAEICRAGGLRLVGPNSIGVASFDTGAVLSFASIYTDHVPQDGPVAIVSQSGAFGVAAYALLREAGCGVRCVAATGNEADVDTADLIEALVQRAGLRLILLYLENVPDRARMAAALDAARQRGVAMLAVRSGRSDHGSRSADLHTGSFGAGGAELDALFDAHGCRAFPGLVELVASVPLYLAPMPCRASAGRAPRLALVSNSGASCVLAADEAEASDLPLARLSAESERQLDELLPDFSLNRNPVDLTAMLLTSPALLGDVMQVVLRDEAVDAAALGLLAVGGPSYDVPRFVRECRTAMEATAKPVIVYSPHAHVREAFALGGFAVFTGEAQAMQALRGFAAHCVGSVPRALSTAPSSTSPASRSVDPMEEPTHA
ncbi:Long-chain-fatty-acid--CoA ligase [Variovorax sp. PBL-H6]|uniref:AMP-binding protein n=1 Tax=Variovorax sp. PBL-H6 TaxID=434009 RepID=UPI001316AC79|nr:AMP-binding protein [Variovorax sp. PBL-H6]VTU21522.1 Long-chain-fatty-acid--CoA ligase [Variovorax sp. PBL-H6]